MQIRILTLSVSLLLAGCAEPYLTEEAEAEVMRVMGEHGEAAVTQLNGVFELFEIEPLPEVSDTFALRVIQHFSGFGHRYYTEVAVQKDGFAYVTYKTARDDRIHIERVQKLVEPEFKLLRTRKGEFDNVWNWSILREPDDDKQYHDGTAWIIEITQSGRRHMVIRSSFAIPADRDGEELKTLLDALKPYQK